MSLIHGEMIFVYDVRLGSNFIICVWKSICPSSISPLCIFGMLVKNHLTIYVRFYFWALCSIPLIYIPVFVPVPHCFDYSRFVIYFEIRKRDASSFVLLAQNSFGYSGSFVAVYEFYEFFSISIQNAIEVLVKTALNL